jgi:hypothetical protein
LYLLLSIIFHTAVLVLVLLWNAGHPKKSQDLQRKETVWIIDPGGAPSKKQSPSQPQGQSKARSQGKSKSRAKGKKSGPPEGALNLGLAPRGSKGSHDSQGTEETVEENFRRGGHKDGYDVANGMDLNREGELYPFFGEIWKRVNAVTPYPHDFVQQRVKGQVTVQGIVSRKGVFSSTVVKVNGEEPLLNTYVLAALVHALRKPLPEHLWSDKDQMVLVFQFDFSLFGPGSVPKKEDQQHFKNVLYFQRDSYVDPKVNQVINKIFTRYIPPVIIFPGGAYVDFYRAYQMIHNIGTPDPDDLRQKRIEIQKEQWDQLIKNSESEPES